MTQLQLPTYGVAWVSRPQYYQCVVCGRTGDSAQMFRAMSGWYCRARQVCRQTKEVKR